MKRGRKLSVWARNRIKMAMTEICDVIVRHVGRYAIRYKLIKNSIKSIGLSAFCHDPFDIYNDTNCGHPRPALEFVRGFIRAETGTRKYLDLMGIIIIIAILLTI